MALMKRSTTLDLTGRGLMDAGLANRVSVEILNCHRLDNSTKSRLVLHQIIGGCIVGIRDAPKEIWRCASCRFHGGRDEGIVVG